jgi:hypothetical protein
MIECRECGNWIDDSPVPRHQLDRELKRISAERAKQHKETCSLAQSPLPLVEVPWRDEIDVTIYCRECCKNIGVLEAVAVLDVAGFNIVRSSAASRLGLAIRLAYERHAKEEHSDGDNQN